MEETTSQKEKPKRINLPAFILALLSLPFLFSIYSFLFIFLIFAGSGHGSSPLLGYVLLTFHGVPLLLSAIVIIPIIFGPAFKKNVSTELKILKYCGLTFLLGFVVAALTETLL